MARNVEENRLALEAFEVEVHTEPSKSLMDQRETLPHLVFFIPGMRNYGEWAIEARFKSADILSLRDFDCRCIRGNGASSTGRLEPFHLLTRLGIDSYRESFKKQIINIAKKTPSFSIDIVAHSMGTSLFSEIVKDVANELKKLNRKIDNIIYLGSISHRKHSEVLHNNCRRFFNHVGQNDMWAFRASYIRRDVYSSTGLIGFRDGYTDDIFFDLDHYQCVMTNHLESCVFPTIQGTAPRMGGAPSETLPDILQRKKVFWDFVVLSVFIALITLIWFIL